MRYYKTGLVSAMAIMLCGATAFAQPQNARQRGDRIFTEPNQGLLSVQGMEQIVLGVGDVMLAKAIFPDTYPEAANVKSAMADFKVAIDAPTSEAQRNELIDSIMKDPANHVAGTESSLTEEAENRITHLRTASIVSDAEKQKLITTASEELNSARATAANTLAKKGLLAKVGLTAKVLGSTLFLADAAGRVYVWFAMDANPTWSPAYAYLNHELRK